MENWNSEGKEILPANINEKITIPDLEVGEPAAEVHVRDPKADAANVTKPDVKEEVFDEATKELEVEVNKSMKDS